MWRPMVGSKLGGGLGVLLTELGNVQLNDYLCVVDIPQVGPIRAIHSGRFIQI